DNQDRFTEIEIKISKADLKADFKKAHGHRSKIISRLIYAVPKELEQVAIELIPKDAGLIVCEWKSLYPGSPIKLKAYWKKMVKHKVIEVPSSATIQKFKELGCMRIWSLKKHNTK